jgi:Ca2+-binding RTX toxin-like protein
MRHRRGAVALATGVLVALAAATAQAGMVEAGPAGESTAHLGFFFRDARYVGGDIGYKQLDEPNNLTIETTAYSVGTFTDNRTITARDNEYGQPHDCIASGWRAVCQDSGMDVAEYIAQLGGAGDRATASGGGTVNLQGGPGNDTLINQDVPTAFLSGDAGDDYLQGGPGDDRIADDFNNTVPGNDVMKGGDGNDIITSDEGSDWIDAGPGDDSVLIRGSATPAALACGAGDDYLQLPVGSTIVPPLDCERVYYSG